MTRRTALAGMLAGVALLAASGTLMERHLQAMRSLRDGALPLAAELPPLENRLQLLKQQAELTERNAAMRSDSPLEKLHVYVLPESDDLTRPLAFLDVLREYLAQRGMLRSLSAVDVGDARIVEGVDGLRARTLSFSAIVSTDGLQTLLSLLRVSGTITVGDVLGPDDLQKLFALTEAENYAGIVPVEKFLSADLLTYAQNPQPYEQQLIQSFPSEQFLRAFHGLLQSSGLADTRTLLQSGLGNTLAKQKLWPTPFFQPVSIATEEQGKGWVKVEMKVEVYARGER